MSSNNLFQSFEQEFIFIEQTLKSKLASPSHSKEWREAIQVDFMEGEELLRGMFFSLNYNEQNERISLEYRYDQHLHSYYSLHNQLQSMIIPSSVPSFSSSSIPMYCPDSIQSKSLKENEEKNKFEMEYGIEWKREEEGRNEMSNHVEISVLQEEKEPLVQSKRNKNSMTILFFFLFLCFVLAFVWIHIHRDFPEAQSEKVLLHTSAPLEATVPVPKFSGFK
eukprot:TRINITY_DN1799_c0_g1_i1.p1 TRINITY_DN1799_c0_g1~~TRINITY_DN1799_c0_g1_i1.p1  ORF type:complete len:222 (-),score=95.42 TRINITY_DN1799_c0_g1_i1:160-825(-)